MEAIVYNIDNNEVGKVTLSDHIFGKEYMPDILARVIQWQKDKARSGCHQAKERNEVSGSTRKIYRQKGTGQARHGSIKAPIFVGGGIVFGPHVRDHGYKLNKKIRKLALMVALSKKFADNDLFILDSVNASDTTKTKELNVKIKSITKESVLFIDGVISENFSKAVRNIKHVNTLPVVGLNVYDLIKHKKIVLTQEAIKKIEERLS